MAGETADVSFFFHFSFLFFPCWHILCSHGASPRQFFPGLSWCVLSKIFCASLPPEWEGTLSGNCPCGGGGTTTKTVVCFGGCLAEERQQKKKTHVSVSMYFYFHFTMSSSKSILCLTWALFISVSLCLLATAFVHLMCNLKLYISVSLCLWDMCFYLPQFEGFFGGWIAQG